MGRQIPEADSEESLSATARAAQWASRIMTVSLEMVLPGFLGYWLDLKLGTKVLFMLVGFALGSFIAISHLIAMTKPKKEAKDRQSGDDPH